jgi:beta-glucosidase
MMRSPTLSSSSLVALIQFLGRASAQSGSSAGSISFPDPTGVSTTYSSKTYDVSAATTTLANDDFSDERLAFLWNQVGPVATGPVTDTVEPTPEPSAYGNPSGGFHPYIPTYETNLSAASLPEGFSWGVASSAFQIEVYELIPSHRNITNPNPRVRSTPKAKAPQSGTSSATASSTKSPTTRPPTSPLHTTTSTSKTSPA